MHPAAQPAQPVLAAGIVVASRRLLHHRQSASRHRRRLDNATRHRGALGSSLACNGPTLSRWH